jgi:hypothetical protein
MTQRYALGVSVYAPGVGRSKARHQLREVVCSDVEVDALACAKGSDDTWVCPLFGSQQRRNFSRSSKGWTCYEECYHIT